jgi:CBS domain-containing protein
MTETNPAGAITMSALIGDQIARVAADASLYAVADALEAAGVGALVMGDGDRPSGIVSERDLVHALAARRDPATTRASDIAHTTLLWCDEDSTVAEVAEEMMANYIRHVLVEVDGRLIGVVSARDLLGVYAAGELEPT